ncbi:MAG: hypothetical protein LBV34_11945 [Nocardiopsaceae bacterium]|jgi:hypothetical protein|nr:hypothetical protein [Nocardiopsaceae bacterium]
MADLPGPGLILGAHGSFDLGPMPFSGRYIVLSLAAIAVIVVILWIPVLSDHINGALSRTAPWWVPIMLFSGAVLLSVGLTVHAGPLAVTGGVLIGVVTLAVLIDNY